MRILDGRYLEDGRLFNDGREVKLIEIQEPADYDRLLDNILNSGYYGENYFEQNLSHQNGQIKYENLALAEMAHVLNPGSLLELGCSRGDVLYLLHLAGRGDLAGIELSQDAAKSAPPEVRDKILTGGMLELCREMAAQGRRFDTILGFDIWEHLHPAQLGANIAALREITADDALLLFVIPAFGQDRVFGELHPLELEENRAALNEHRPFDFLLAEQVDPPIPANGHLIWADSHWWEEQFKAHGFYRAVEVEAGLHHLFDPYLWRAQKGFYVLHKESQGALERIDKLCKYHLDLLYLWRTKLHFFRVLQRRRMQTGQELIELNSVMAALDDAGVRLQDYHIAQSAQMRGKVAELENHSQLLHKEVVYLKKMLFPLVWLRKLLARCLPQSIKDRLSKT